MWHYLQVGGVRVGQCDVAGGVGWGEQGLQLGRTHPATTNSPTVSTTVSTCAAGTDTRSSNSVHAVDRWRAAQDVTSGSVERLISASPVRYGSRARPASIFPPARPPPPPHSAGARTRRRRATQPNHRPPPPPRGRTDDVELLRVRHVHVVDRGGQVEQAYERVRVDHVPHGGVARLRRRGAGATVSAARRAAARAAIERGRGCVGRVVATQHRRRLAATAAHEARRPRQPARRRLHRRPRGLVVADGLRDHVRHAVRAAERGQPAARRARRELAPLRGEVFRARLPPAPHDVVAARGAASGARHRRRHRRRRLRARRRAAAAAPRGDVCAHARRKPRGLLALAHKRDAVALQRVRERLLDHQPLLCVRDHLRAIWWGWVGVGVGVGVVGGGVSRPRAAAGNVVRRAHTPWPQTSPRASR